MANGPDKPRDVNPLSEEQILDWIEGNLSPEVEARLAASAARPGLDARVRQMQANRRALAALQDEPAPAELCERVLAALERDALLGLTRGESAFDSIPVSRVPAGRGAPGVIARIMNTSPSRFAMAAGLLVAAGAAVYLGMIATRQGQTQNTSGTEPIGPVAILTGPEAVGGTTPDSTPGAMATSEIAAPAPVSLATQLLADPAPMDLARAVQAAREGRLVMRVVATNAGGLSQIESAATRDAGVRDWRLTRSVPPGIVAGVQPTTKSPGRAAGPEFAMAGMAYAADPLRLIGPGAALAWTSPPTVDRASRVRATYLVDVPASEDMLQIIKALFASATSASVVFEELPEAISAPRRIEPEDVLWWTQSTARWTPRVAIPVVVEER